MAYKRKYKKGRRIESLEELMVIYRQKAFIWTHCKAYHFGWWGSWQLVTLERQIKGGHIFLAVENEN